MEAKNSNKITSLLFLGLIILLTNCGKTANDESGAIEVGTGADTEMILTDAQFATMKMEWGHVMDDVFAEDLPVQGMIQVPVEGLQEVSVYFGGYVVGLKLIEGKPVKKGEVLFYLENPDIIKLQQDFLEAKSQLDYLKADFERQKTLFNEQIAAEKNYLKAEADYQAMLAKTESLKKQLNLININTDELRAESIRTRVPVLSPVSGFVDMVHVVPGQFVPASGKAVTLINRERMHLELSVFEKDAINLRQGQKITFNLPDSPQEKHVAEVHLISQSVNEQRVVKVHGDFDEKTVEGKVVPGMFVEASIALDPKEGWSLPVTAVIETEEGYQVIVQKRKIEGGYEIEAVPVQVGRKTSEKMEILPGSGINENSLILLKGGFNLL
ncbi:efflux RND transporter periplasmic adaptor subunit [Algoriphagus sp. CAU 1675]|uniref:efflux RND transporter periplasmic adaptor subunit n=1 Tax=Algoriphagus sp. CAU 1675 TaxID=3032597 RepID=UPI0023DCA5CF|nr:efflux RND transporter periplasmic adaptor subunit [Algoriphagus sp. CAU 1675]MDF2158500.1 efflux RND transporter periplasmic adaptor subunit [Algoriphagus sp. CAU 1675]